MGLTEPNPNTAYPTGLPLHQATEASTDDPMDAERLIRRAFLTDADQGVALLFRYYYQPLCSHAVRYVSSREVAEDLVSDIFFEFHSRQIYQTVSSSFRAYLFTAVRNRALDYIRTEYRQAASLEQAQERTAEAGQQPDDVMQFEELYQSIESAINNMPVKQRTVYLMHRFEGRKYADIATELGMSPKTVEVHMYRAMQALRETVRNKWLLSLLLCCLSGV